MAGVLPSVMLGMTLGATQDVVKYGVKAARTVVNGYGRRSLARLAKEAIFQFPCIFSNDIDSDEISVIAQAYEKEYASFVVAAISLEHNVDRRKYESTRDFLKTFHNNGNMPALVFNSGNIMLESAHIIPSDSVYIDKLMLQSLWTENENQFDTSVANEMYLPFNRTMHKIEQHLGIATEARGKTKGKDDKQIVAGIYTNAQADAYKRKMDIDSAAIKEREDEKYKRQRDDALKDRDEEREYREGEYDRQLKLKEEADKRKALFSASAELTKQHNAQRSGSNVSGGLHKMVHDGKDKMYHHADGTNTKLGTVKDVVAGIGDLSKPAVVVGKDQTVHSSIVRGEGIFSQMAPTLVNVVLVNFTDATTWNDAITIGVKSMIRLVPTGQMVANMVEACKDQKIFKFIKYTKGETNFFDQLFGISKYKKMGIDNAKGKWLAALQKRASIDNVSRFFGARLLPSTTIIITEAEAIECKRQCGVDLHDKATMRRIFKKYFLLGFGIYDTETRILNAIFDGDDEWTSVPMRQMVANIKKETDLLATAGHRFM